MANKKARRKTRFVPRAILGSAAVASVVPALALVDCSGGGGNYTVACFCGQDATPDGTYPDALLFTVAALQDAAHFDAGQDAAGDAEQGDAEQGDAEHGDAGHGEGGQDSGVG